MITKRKVVIFFLSIAAFTAVAILMKNGGFSSFDKCIQDAFFALRTEAGTRLIVPFSYSGNWQCYVPVCLILLAIPKTRYSYGIPVSFSALFSVSIYKITKTFIKRPRPDLSVRLLTEHGFSFPSGHTLTSICTWGIIIFLLIYYYKTRGKSLPMYRKHDYPTELYIKSRTGLAAACIFCVVYFIGIALSRIYVGVHWPSDILGSWVLSAAIFTVNETVVFRNDFAKLTRASKAEKP